MGEVYKELDEVKAELQKLKEEFTVKTELSESLRRAHTDSQLKSQEAKLQIEKQTKELNVKSEEVAELRQLYEEVKSRLQVTETSLKQVNFVNEKIRIDSNEKVQRLEDEKRKLVSDLEEATARNLELEQKFQACSEDIVDLKARLSEFQRKCAEAEEKARVGKELSHREDVIVKLEEQSMSVQDQLKWKKEQFQHLEEAHKRLQDQFQLKTKEWASEKSSMLEEMMTLQSKLDSQIRISESLESRLRMCNQALAYEESRRKLLDAQLSESKQCYENVLAAYEEAEAKIESLGSKRDEDIVVLRNNLGMKEVILKEIEYNLTHLEQENKELLGTAKELQEAQINKRRVDPSLTKLRNKLKDLEQAHSKCSLTLMEKEAEWNSKMEKLIGDIKCYESDLTTQNEQMNQLKMQLNDCHSAIEVSSEEASILFMVLKAEISNAYSKLFNLEAQTEAASNKRGEQEVVSVKQMGTKDSCAMKSEACLKQAREEIVSLKQKFQSLKSLEQRSNMLGDALEEHKTMLEESGKCQIHLEEHVSQMQDALKDVSAALDKSKSDLSVKITEASQLKLELQLWRSKAESFRTCLEHSQEACKNLETSVLEQVEREKGLRKENESFQSKLQDKDQTISHLQEKIASLNQILEQRDAATQRLEKDVANGLGKEVSLIQMLQEKDTELKNLQKELKETEDQSVRRATTAADLQQKIASLNQILEQKEAAIEEIKLEVAKSVKREEHLLQTLKDRDIAVESLQKELLAMEDQSVGRATAAANSAKLEAQSKYECEREELHRIIKERDETIKSIRKELDALKFQSVKQASAVAESNLAAKRQKEELSQIIASERVKMASLLRDFAFLEKDFTNVSLLTLSQEAESIVQINALQEALRKSEVNMNAEIKRKKTTIKLLESEVKNLCGKILLQEQSLNHSNHSIKELEALTEAMNAEMFKLESEFKEERTKLTEQVKEIELQKQAATECINMLTSERDSLLMYIEEINEKFGDFCTQGAEFNGWLERMVPNSDECDAPTMSYVVTPDKVREAVWKFFRQENGQRLIRSPLRERNQ